MTRTQGLSLLAIVTLLIAGATVLYLRYKMSAPVPLTGSGSWPPKNFNRVIGYYFCIPEPEFSIIQESGIDMTTLRRTDVISKELNSDQIKKLINAALYYPKTASPAACYSPHHIFLFFDRNNKISNAIEVCFGCTTASALPPLDESFWRHQDFRALARLCDELGIWDNKGLSVKKYIQLRDENDSLLENNGEQDAAANP